MFGNEMVPFWTAVAAAAAATSAVAAAIYTFLTYRLVAAQAEPRVVAFVMSDPDRQTMLLIRIQNIGRDVALDVSFKSSRPIPAHAWGLALDPPPPPAAVMKEGPLVEGIAALGPGDSRDITWGQYGGLLQAVGRTPIEIEISYKHGGRTLRGRGRLEIASYTGTDDSQRPPEVIARQLKEIAKAAESIAKDVHSLERRAQIKAG
jgi:hypothetical protein